MARVHPPVGVREARGAVPLGHRAVVEPARDDLAELAGAGTEVLGTVVESGAVDGPGGHPTTDGPALVEDDRVDADLGQHAGGREPGQAGADDEDGG